MLLCGDKAHCTYVILCAIWYHLNNFKNVKNWLCLCDPCVRQFLCFINILEHCSINNNGAKLRYESRFDEIISNQPYWNYHDIWYFVCLGDLLSFSVPGGDRKNLWVVVCKEGAVSTQADTMVFLKFFKLYKCYQIPQSVSYI